ncbi:MAG TPA: FtsX-like permease family protein [Candidatus Polarisedimenticolaceae bacterium]|nr:FtsX-like permease family protein [Candidatus Polarisedimenticolaceae bacterium]
MLRAAAENVAGNWRVYAVASSGLVLALTLLSSGVAIGEGLREQALDGVRQGADVYCTWDTFGRDAAVPRNRIAALEGLDGVVRVVPRIVGRLQLGDRLAVVVGVPLAQLTQERMPLEGALPASPAEILVGQELARALGLAPGGRVLLEAATSRVFVVSGVLGASSALWSSKAIVCDLDEAALLFGEAEQVSDVCLYTRPGYALRVAQAVQRLDPRFRVQTREFVATYVLRGMAAREGAFTVLAALALALAIPTFALFTYLGYAPRRREIGLLKAEGWRTADVLEMVALENLLVSAIVTGGALLLSALWVRPLRAPLVAPFFLPDLPLFPAMRIPARFLPLAAPLALAFSLVVTMTGSLYATWRTAATRPVEVLR